jgi:hypothetical protein
VPALVTVGETGGRRRCLVGSVPGDEREQVEEGALAEYAAPAQFSFVAGSKA